MTTTASGQAAERIAAKYLTENGYSVLQMNWRTKRCEIDIVATNNFVVYFVEVKFRNNPFQGSGFSHITAKKIKQMSYAAEYWVADNGWANDYSLAVIEISGPEMVITGFEKDFL